MTGSGEPPAPAMQVTPDPDAACRVVAERIVHAAGRAVEARGRFAMAVSGGASPIPVFRLLAGELRERVRWPAVHVWLTDERCVPPGHPASNWGMLARELLDRVDIPPAHAHRFAGELAPAEAARRADAELAGYVDAVRADPAFDLVLLGVGDDGHTASLFPGGAELEARRRLVVASRAPEGVEVRDRVTLTLPALAMTREVLVLAYGAGKRDAVRAAWAGTVPAGLVRGREGTTWVVDEAARA